jgi:hypothetical protein
MQDRVLGTAIDASPIQWIAQLSGHGVKPNVRKITAIAFTLVLTAVPTEFRRDHVLDPSEPWGWIDAAARVRFAAQRSISSDEDNLTLHTAIVLGIFKNHPLLSPPTEPVALIERRGFMQSDHGPRPCWDNEQPIPVGTEAIVFLQWHADLRAFWLGGVSGANLRMTPSSGKCE